MAEASSAYDDHHGEDFFDKSAKKWDSKPGVLETTEKVYSHLVQHLEKAGKPLSKLRYLEIGCGTGNLAVRVAQHFAEVVAVDTSQGMVDAVRAKAENADVQNLQAVKQAVASGDDLAPYGFFDVAIIVLTLHHIQDAQGILDAMTSRLAPGGNLIVVDFANDDGSDFHTAAGVNLEEAGVYHANGFSEKLIRAMFVSSGLEVVSVTSPFGMKVAWMEATGSDDKEVNGHSGGHGHSHSVGHGHSSQGHGHSHGGHGHGHSEGLKDPNAEFPLVFAVAAKK